MRVLAIGGAIDERSARAALDLARAQRVDRVLAFPQGGAEGVHAAVRREARAIADVFLDASARWLLSPDESASAEPPPARTAAFASTHLSVVTDAEPSAADRRLTHHSALVVELVGSFVLLAVPGAARATEARDSAHILLHGGPEVVVDVRGGRAVLCPGDIARGGALLIVDGPPDPRVSLWSLDGMVLDARTLVLGQNKLTVQGGAR